jgi:hypothetical protein
MRALFSRRCPGRAVELLILVALVALATSTGCGNGANITLLGTMSTTDPAATNGDGTTDNWTDLTSDPKGFAIGIQSAILTGADGSSFTIFDQGTDPNNALFERFYETPATIRMGSNSDIGNGTYDTLELKLVYYEADVNVFDDTGTQNTRRLRVYFQNYKENLSINSQTVSPFDQLISSSNFTNLPTSGTGSELGSTGQNQDLNWIDPANGSLCPTRNACNGGIPYQVPTTVFPSYPVVKIDLGSNDIVVNSDTDTTFNLTLTFNVGGLFFYDNTDTDTNFNYLLPPPPASPSSYDGKIEAACTLSNCSSGSGNKQEADFWIGPPQFSVDVTSQ